MPATASAATHELGEFQMNWWIDSIAKTVAAIKADDVSPKLQNEFYEKATHPWTQNNSAVVTLLLSLTGPALVFR